MSRRPTPTSSLAREILVASEIIREASERAASICATAAEVCAASEHLVIESKAAREARQSRPGRRIPRP